MNIEIGDIVLADTYIGVVSKVIGNIIEIKTHLGTLERVPRDSVVIINKAADTVKLFVGGIKNVESRDG